jgi:hypothetical protein
MTLTYDIIKYLLKLAKLEFKQGRWDLNEGSVLAGIISLIKMKYEK